MFKVFFFCKRALQALAHVQDFVCLQAFRYGIRRRLHISSVSYLYEILAMAPPALAHFSALFQISGIRGPDFLI